jgi:hypothetical protein
MFALLEQAVQQPLAEDIDLVTLTQLAMVV